MTATPRLPRLRAMPVLLGSAGLLAAFAAQADGPLRGNPVDALPRMESPADARQAPPPAVSAPTPEQQAVQARLAQRIVPRYFDVSGVHSIPFGEVTAILEPLAGKETTVGELARQVDAITALYRERGYPLSFAVLQNQTFQGGHVAVTVVEGHVGQVRVEGEIGGARDRLLTLAQPLIDEKPLTRATLERQLNLMRAVPGVKFTPALDLPRRADGATELVLEATRKPLSVTGGVADLGTGMQGLVNVAANSLTPLGEQVRLTAGLPVASDDVRYFAGEVSVPVGSSGLAVKADGYHYRAEPEDEAVEALGYDRKVRNDRLGLAVSYPLLLDNRHSLVGSVGAYMGRSRDRYSQRGGDAWLEHDVRTRVAAASLRYTEIGESQSREAKLEVAKGFDALGAKKRATNSADADVPKLNYDLDFTRVNLDLRQTVKLPAGFGLTAAAAGQYSSDILPTSEQVSFGSWRYGMGYPQGELGGDKGVGASLEVNRRFGLGWRYLAAVQPYALVDWARTWYNAPGLREYNDRHLSSVALGLRVTDDRYYLFDFNVAKPVGDRTSDDGDRGLRVNANYSLFYDAF